MSLRHLLPNSDVAIQSRLRKLIRKKERTETNLLAIVLKIDVRCVNPSSVSVLDPFGNMEPSAIESDLMEDMERSYRCWGRLSSQIRLVMGL